MSEQCLFHMSMKLHSVGDVLTGNGLDKVDPLIETSLEACRPKSSVSRRDAIFCRPVPDFHMIGIEKGYIFRLESTDSPDLHDLTWLKEPQLALFKLKYPDFSLSASYPDWSDDLLEKCCRGYWSAEPTGTPIWELLVKEATVAEVVSSSVVQAKDTAGRTY